MRVSVAFERFGRGFVGATNVRCAKRINRSRRDSIAGEDRGGERASTKSKRYRYPTPERIAVGLAGAGGLTVAACISALPSASCRAIAQTYFNAIDAFGSAGFAGLIIYFLSYLPHPPHGRVSEKVWRVFWTCLVYLTVAMGVGALIGGVISAEASLEKAIPICWKEKSPLDSAGSSWWMLFSTFR